MLDRRVSQQLSLINQSSVLSSAADSLANSIKGTMSQTPIRPGHRSPQAVDQFISIETGDRSVSGMKSQLNMMQKKLLLKPKKKGLNQT